jgi:hypothetical protein
MFFALQVDRGNLVRAVSDTFLADLKLTTNGKSISSYHRGCQTVQIPSCLDVLLKPEWVSSTAIVPWVR